MFPAVAFGAGGKLLIPEERLTQLTPPMVCVEQLDQKHSLAKRLKKRPRGVDLNLVAVRKIPVRKLERLRSKASRLEQRMDALSSRIETLDETTRVARRARARLTRLTAKRDRYLRLPGMEDECLALSGDNRDGNPSPSPDPDSPVPSPSPPSGVGVECITQVRNRSFDFLPGSSRELDLALGITCDFELNWQLIGSLPEGLSIENSILRVLDSAPESSSQVSFEVCVESPNGACGNQVVQVSACAIEALADSFSLEENQTSILALSGIDSCEGEARYGVTTAPVHGQLGSFDGSSIDYQIGYFEGTDSFSFRICNDTVGGCSAEASVAVSVAAAPSFSGNPGSLRKYREHISLEEKRHLAWKLGLNSPDLINEETRSMGLTEFVERVLLNEAWHPAATRAELNQLRDGVSDIAPYTFQISSRMDPFITDQPDLSDPDTPPSGTHIPLFRTDELFDTPAERSNGVRRLMSVGARSFHQGNRNYHWGPSVGNGYMLFRARYLNPAHARMMHLLFSTFGTSGIVINGQQESWVGHYIYKVAREAFGNFESLMLGSTTDGCVHAEGDEGGIICDSLSNFWLDNHQNDKNNPNENFPRELMELYTLGPVDPITGLANYNDLIDIPSATRFLSGYKVSGGYFHEIQLEFRSNQHSDESRSMFTDLAGFYPNLPIDNESLQPREFVAHLLAEHPSAPRFLSRKLIRMLVTPTASDALVEEGAQMLKASGYDLHAFLVQLATSELMFSDIARAPSCVVSPYEQFAKMINGLKLSLVSRKTGVFQQCNTDMNQNGCQERFLRTFSSSMGQSSERILGYDSVFTHDYCGEDEGKDGSSAWLPASNLLARTTGFVSFLRSHEQFMRERNTPGAVTNFHSLVDEIPVQDAETGLTPEDVIAFFVDRFSLELAAEETDILVEYLTHDWNNGSPTPIGNWNPNDSSFMEKKLAGLTAIIASLPQTNIG